MEKLVSSIENILYKSEIGSDREIYDLNYYKFSSEAFHLSFLLFEQCSEVDEPLRKIYAKMIKKLK